jgi:hypothetical protein
VIGLGTPGSRPWDSSHWVASRTVSARLGYRLGLPAAISVATESHLEIASIRLPLQSSAPARRRLLQRASSMSAAMVCIPVYHHRQADRRTCGARNALRHPVWCKTARNSRSLDPGYAHTGRARPTACETLEDCPAVALSSMGTHVGLVRSLSPNLGLTDPIIVEDRYALWCWPGLGSPAACFGQNSTTTVRAMIESLPGRRSSLKAQTPSSRSSHSASAH